jgi:uncharacterized membrane protein YebE (DUF533 family)
MEGMIHTKAREDTMTHQNSQLVVKAGPVAAAVIGGSPLAVGTATVALGIGAAVAVAAVGYGIYSMLGNIKRGLAK